MKAIGEMVLMVVTGLVVLATVATRLISLSHALVPVLVIGALAVIAVRLAWFHTRRW